jgi:hypothetical protein
MYIRFYVPGAPVGFKAGPRNQATNSKIASYAEKVRLYAKQAGLKLPLESTKMNAIRVATGVAFQNGSRHPDAENVHKLIKDILFYQGTTYVDKTGALCVRKHGYGQDRYTCGQYDYCYRFKPGVIVTIEQNTQYTLDAAVEIGEAFMYYEGKAHVG